MNSAQKARRARVGLWRRLAQLWRKAPLWRRALILLSALPALLLLENLLLWSKVICLVIGLAPPVTFDYGFAWSLIPGQVHVYDLEMTVEDRAIQMQLNADVIVARIRVTELLSKKVHIDGATAQGLVLKIRPVVEEKARGSEWVGTFPPIQGLADPPLWRHPERPRPATENLWKVRVSGIDAMADAIWVGPVHLSGPMEIEGGFELHPRTMLEILPTRLRFGHQGGEHTLAIGEEPFSVDAEFEVEAKLPPLYFKKDNHLLDLLRFHARGNFPFEDLSAFDPLLPPGRVGFDAHGGVLNVNAGLTNAHFEPDSRVTLRADQAELELNAPSAEYRFRGPLSVGALVRSVDDEHQLLGELSFRDLVVTEKGTKLAPGSIKEASASSMVALSKDLSFVPQETKIRIVDFHIPDLAILNPLLEETPVRVTAGSSTLQMECALQGMQPTSAQLQLKAVGARVKLAEQPGSTQGPIVASFGARLIANAQLDSAHSRLRVDPVTLQVSPFLVNWGDGEVSWPFVLSTTHAEHEFEPPRDLSYWNLEGPSLKPVLDMMLKKGMARFAAKLVLGSGGTKSRVRLERAGEVTRADLLSFESGRVAVDGTAQFGGERVQGALVMKAPELTIGLDLSKADKLVHPLVSASWLEEELTRQGIPKPKGF